MHYKITKAINKILLIITFVLFGTLSYGQHYNIIKGTSEFRNIILANHMVNLHKVEKIRRKLDSLGVNDKTFERFYYNLNYVSKNLYTGELDGRQYMVDALKSSIAYKNLSKDELATIIENFELIHVCRNGFWEERYPHNLDVNSLRIKEISQYGIRENDRILHFFARKNHVCEILYLSFDSIHITHNPYKFAIEENKIFETVSRDSPSHTRTISYSFEEKPSKKQEQLYDKIIFDCLGMLFLKYYPDLKKNMSIIHNILAPDGELIVGANYQTFMFDGQFPAIEEVDKRIKRILKHGFLLKERLYVENEYVVYKFVKFK